MKELKKFWSKKIQTLVPYVAGEQPKDRVYIKLNTNENPYPPSPNVLAAIRDNADERLSLYPDGEAQELCAAIAEFHHLKPEQVFCGNGSDEVLGFCFYAFFDSEREIVFPDITYSFYPVYARLFGLQFKEIPLDVNFDFPIESFFNSKGGAVICNPNAPTGKSMPLDAVRSIIEANRDVVVIVDEAYVDFGAQSVASMIDEYDNLVVVCTLSKSRSLAGMRIGYALAHPDLIAGIRCVKNSFNSYPLDRLAQAAAVAAMKDTAYFDETRHKVIATRTWVTERMRAMGFVVHDSNTNFIYAAHQTRSGKEIQQMLREQGVLVRRFDGARVSDYLRISIGNDEEMETMCRILKEILG